MPDRYLPDSDWPWYVIVLIVCFCMGSVCVWLEDGRQLGKGDRKVIDIKERRGK